MCSRDKVSRCGVLANMVESMCSILLWERLRLRMDADASARAKLNRLSHDCSLGRSYQEVYTKYLDSDCPAVTLNKSMCKICQFIPEDGIATNALWERSIDSRAVD